MESSSIFNYLSALKFPILNSLLSGCSKREVVLTVGIVKRRRAVRIVIMLCLYINFDNNYHKYNKSRNTQISIQINK
jgi:hypothetical protein